ncbi:MAG: acyltransferase domain-containing protein, partial [Frankia sp.]
LPATLHAATPSSHVDWTDQSLALLGERRDWVIPENGTRRAGVSSFGISGTNAHVILEQAPVAEPTAPAVVRETDPTPVQWLISAKTRAGLAAQATKLADRLDGLTEWDPSQVAAALDAKPFFGHRAAISGTTPDELIGGLRTLATGETTPAVVVGQATGAGKIAFCYSGQGSQRLGMGRGLYEAYPVYAHAFDAACAALDPHLPRPLTSVVFGDDPELINQTLWTQTSLFAVHTALTALLTDHGVQPAALIGHSIGQLSAAHAAGVFGLDQAAKLVATRATLMQNGPTGGHMINIAATPDELEPHLAAAPDVSIAALNTPGNTVIAGDPYQTQQIAAHFEGMGRKTRRLTVSHAFHSPHMNPILTEFQKAAEIIGYQNPTIPIISNDTGAFATPEELTTPDTWTAHIRNTVKYADGITTLQENGTTHYLEIGPDTTLTTLTSTCLDHVARSSNGSGVGKRRGDPVVIPTLHPKQPDITAFPAALGHLATTVARPPAGPAGAGRSAVDLELPTYAFSRETFWLAAPPAAGDVTATGLTPATHPLLSTQTGGPDGTLTATGTLTTASQPWIPDHAINGTVLLPATALVDLALHLGGETGHPHVDELTLHAPLVLGETPTDLYATLAPAAGPADDDDVSHRELTVHTRAGAKATGNGEWTLHVTATLTTRAAPPTDRTDPAVWPPAGTTAGPDPADLYRTLDTRGYSYGPTFAGLVAAHVGPPDGQRTLHAVATLPAGVPTDGYTLHPALLDAALHPLFLLDGSPLETEELSIRLPFSWTDIDVVPRATDTLHVEITTLDAADTVSFRATTPGGEPVLSIRELSV